MKRLAVILAGIMAVLTIATSILSSRLQTVQTEKADILLTVNRTLLDSHDKGFHALGCGQDALGYLIEGRAEEYRSQIDNARKSRELFDALYDKAKTALGALPQIESRIHAMESWLSGMNAALLLLALSILLVSVYAGTANQKKAAP
jgi:hypothetical protein